jgi:hypothetical protein
MRVSPSAAVLYNLADVVDYDHADGVRLRLSTTATRTCLYPQMIFQRGVLWSNDIDRRLLIRPPDRSGIPSSTVI